jgi:hypothetical protein
MSQLKVNEIVDANGGNNAVLFGVASPPNSMGFRNRIINGEMRIDQRNAGAAVTATNSYAVDRFVVNNTTDGAFSAQQDSSAPVGFTKSLKYTTTTADTSLTGTQATFIGQNIEGLNFSDLAWGTANAAPVTLSFWVRSSLTGTFGGALRNNANNRSYPYSYAISAANTWEYKTVTIAGDTTGTWLTDNGIGVRVAFSIGSGPDRSGTAGAWNSNNNTSATGAVSVVGTNGATFYLTGVQLEAGSVATPFERRPYGTELALCERYFEICSSGVVTGPNLSGGFIGAGCNFRQTKRATPTVTRLSDLRVGGVNTPGIQDISVNGFTSVAQTTGTSTCAFTTIYSASIEL